MESGQGITASSRRRRVVLTSSPDDGACGDSGFGKVWRLYPVALVTIFPVALLSNFWLEIWNGVRSRATDGSGHWGISQIFNANIFPDTFGWTNAYFGGMPFPNFYPPLFHWLVGLLNWSGLFSHESAFKLVLVAPVLMMPAAVWVLTRRLSRGSDRVATMSACACVLLLVSMHIQTSTCGLDYSSTFVAGFYTQPLGFVLLLAWFCAYARAGRSRLLATLSCALLALTILANFFNAITGALLILSTLALDFLSLRSANGEAARRIASGRLRVHLLTPLVALALCLFWLVPMFGTYEFFVTRPLVIPLGRLITPWLWCWYVVAAVGVALWIRKAGGVARAYLLTLLLLAVAVVFASTVAPSWFPLQAFRFLSTLNFMLAVPVGLALDAALRFFNIKVRRPRSAWGVARHVCVVFFAIFASGIIQSSHPTGGFAFYAPEENERLESVLGFAREHREGRYAVEVLDVNNNSLHADSPALNAYLGAQGNETLGVVYREASPNSIFFNALINSFSEGKDSFGISSVVADDLDFAAQPLSRQLERARWLGVRYFVVESDAAKERLARVTTLNARHDFDHWSIFEISGDVPQRARVLAYRPALVVSGFSVKSRRRDDFDFIRLAEEQFNEGWFDVLLARSPERKIDELAGLENFGALVLDTYDCGDEARAFALMRDFAQHRALVLLASDAPLFRRIRASISEFPHAHIIERTIDEPSGERIESFQPSFHYEQSPIRRVWRKVRAALEEEKVAVSVEASTVTTQLGPNKMRFTPDAANDPQDLPLLISTTYSPNWRAEEGNQVYAATPFFMLTFSRGPVQIVYGRSARDIAGLWASGFTLLGLFGYAFNAWRRGSSFGEVESVCDGRVEASMVDAEIHAGERTAS